MRLWDGAALVAVVLLAPAGCAGLSAQEQPALLAAPSERAREVVARIVSAAMNGQPVTLADDALMRDSVLLIERRTPPGPQGRAATGRTLEAPERFRLVLRGARCLLVHDADGREWTLDDVACVPVPAGAAR